MKDKHVYTYNFEKASQRVEVTLPAMTHARIDYYSAMDLEDGFEQAGYVVGRKVFMPELTGLVMEDGSDATVSGFGDGFEAEVDFLSTPTETSRACSGGG